MPHRRLRLREARVRWSRRHTPATLAEFTLNGADGKDFYDVSLVDGYNLPMLVVPHGGSGGNCSTTGCVVDLNVACPAELKVASSAVGGGAGSDVACKSACEAFQQPQYCCSGEYGNPNTCKPTSYSEFFKHACPRAYSYAYDDGTSTFTCVSADYDITFCPSLPTSKKASQSQNPQAAELPLYNSTMVFLGGPDVSGAAAHMGSLLSMAVAVVAMWRLSELMF
ncbi:hypothetical protein Scep_000348 [Stephania cephalantha]|uniref:Thaumatin-like protein 1 n=1 Tax=Stephania cephalantha TaxID=152367 RepID=A0AAP0Q2C9_9MAGN